MGYLVLVAVGRKSVDEEGSWLLRYNSPLVAVAKTGSSCRRGNGRFLSGISLFKLLGFLVEDRGSRLPDLLESFEEKVNKQSTLGPTCYEFARWPSLIGCYLISVLSFY